MDTTTTTVTENDIDGDGIVDSITTTTEIDTDSDGTVDSITAVTVSTTEEDLNGDGIPDITTTTVTENDTNADGILDSINTVTDTEFICFLTGTQILTDNGYHPVEKLGIGDLVQTADGELKPIKWIGYQTCYPNRVKDSLRSYPVLIKAGALGENIPSSDLYVSPNHSLLVDGLLINAGALTNDVSIITTEPTETFVYHHIELENHALLIAEGTFAESYLPQKEDRMAYDNGAEYEQLYPQGNKLMLWPLDYPRISSKSKVPRYVRQRLDKIASELYGSEVAQAV